MKNKQTLNISVSPQVSACPSCWPTCTAWCPSLCVEAEAVVSAGGRDEVSASTLMRTTGQSQVRTPDISCKLEEEDVIYILVL